MGLRHGVKEWHSYRWWLWWIKEKDDMTGEGKGKSEIEFGIRSTKKSGVGSRDKVKQIEMNDQLFVIRIVGGRARATSDEERVMWGDWTETRSYTYKNKSNTKYQRVTNGTDKQEAVSVSCSAYCSSAMVTCDKTNSHHNLIRFIRIEKYHKYSADELLNIAGRTFSNNPRRHISLCIPGTSTDTS